MASLLDMTDVPMKNILENCGFKSVLALRKVCHSLRNFIDDSCFKTDLDNIIITIDPTGFSVKCNRYNASWTDASNSKDWTSNDLKIIMKMAQNLKLSYFSVNTNLDNVEGLDDLEYILKNQTRPLQTERFEMTGSKVLKVLPYIDSKALKYIAVFSANHRANQDLDGIEKLMELEQFKNAVELYIDDNFLVRADLRKFFHFQRVHVKFHETSLEELVALKEAFVASTHMEDFELDGRDLDENYLEQLFGTPFHDPLYGEDMQWFFKIQSCKEYVLRIDLHLEQLTFWNWEATDVPQDAIVQH